ncbi:hypothetical protein PCASD_07252 [Puccinia coronata f. sp. avenae]|uniref:Uncharacterized protein n=1 Tax=Puccinia coronata f. sp. avenae TaxID=200324 RepID=A0A2N5UYR8_9BASI|nr:hypothetical protein PCASD_07252 [Puccinia coronata f. sp. avenae]
MHAVPSSPSPRSVAPPLPPLPSPNNSRRSATHVDPDPPTQSSDKPNSIVLITLHPLPVSPTLAPQDTLVVPSDIASIPSPPTTAQAPPPPPRQRP